MGQPEIKGTLWCLHGAVGAAADWQFLTIQGWVIRRVDLWRFLSCCPMSLPEFGAALNREAAALPGRHVLLGYSMGGRLALHALLAGGPWSAGIIVSANPGLEDEADRSTRLEADAEWAARALNADWAEFIGAWQSQPVLGAPSPLQTDRLALVSRRREIARSFIDWSVAAQQPLWDQLHHIHCPLLWIAGKHDHKYQALTARVLRENHHTDTWEGWYPPDSGHRVPWESPRSFTTRIGEFLERLDS